MRSWALIGLVGVSAAASAESYRLVDVSLALPPSALSVAVDLRDNGTFTGMLDGSGGRLKPFVVHGDGRVEVFDGGYYSENYVRAGNGAGTLVGYYPGSFVGWVRNGSELACIPTPLPCASSLYLSSMPWAINEAGTFVGSQTQLPTSNGYQSQGYRGAVDAQGNIQIQPLGRWQNQFDTVAMVIGEGADPRILGYAAIDPLNSQYQPLQWQGGAWAALGTAGRNRMPVAVNAAGIAIGAGRSAGAQSGFVGLRWDLGDATDPGQPLPAFPGATDTRPTDINARAEIVGTASFGYGPNDTRGWVLRNDALVPLDDLLVDAESWTILTAVAINESGQIAATARFGSLPGTRAVLLIPEHADPIFRHSF